MYLLLRPKYLSGKWYGVKKLKQMKIISSRNVSRLHPAVRTLFSSKLGMICPGTKPFQPSSLNEHSLRSIQFFCFERPTWTPSTDGEAGLGGWVWCPLCHVWAYQFQNSLTFPRELIGSFSFCYGDSTVTKSPSGFLLTWVRCELCYCKVEQLV